MIGAHRSGVGFWPILAAAATVGAQVYDQKRQAAADKAAAETAASRAARQGAGSTRWLLIAGGAAAIGLAAYLLTRRKR